MSSMKKMVRELVAARDHRVRSRLGAEILTEHQNSLDQLKDQHNAEVEAIEQGHADELAGECI